ncbi:sterigmatocystin biosynthesis monooxygenase stcW [Aspergillus ochraceoroseus]|uniref:Sterigmatocystin biosynthesis monooxygenase stcW n=1 Tax=Aspergillus ochraceoroseus TaxID=138278 RepID=A0A0F8US10_9EURO|nr:sterigmatocystin biosynthesis monooxygenase stcW [Aspergillus ochraceoroseus]
MVLNTNRHADGSATKVDYSLPGASGYSIPQKTTWMDPENRRLRIITIGAGFSGILMAYQMQKECQNMEHVVYEKDHDIGGTWLKNRYPNAGCDVPSHAYTYRFALYPDWPRYFSYAPDIWSYLDKVCTVFDLRKYMQFHTEVIECRWDDEKGQWKVRLRRQEPGQQPQEFDDYCHVLLNACGVLSNPKWPDIPGLHDRFQGRVIHTAGWPDDYREQQWKDDRVAVIGSGASSVQAVPGMQPHTAHLDVFVRTGVWFGVLAGNNGTQARVYSNDECAEFRKNPKTLVEHAKSIEAEVNGMWGAFYSDSMAQKMASGYFRKRMADIIKDEELLRGFTPTFGFGCRRITPGDPYMEAIQQPNVSVHFTAAERCTEEGVVGADGVERKVDTIVCATGFDNTYRPHFPIIGQHGIDLRDKWDKCPEAYLGLAVPGMPNYITFIGPSWPIQNGSVMAPLHSVSEYAIQFLKKMQNENIRSFAPRQDITDQFNDHVQEWVKHTVWKDDCRSWYKNNETGRVNAIWPGSSLHYQQVVDRPRYEDFEIRYFDSNPWAHLGMGWTILDREGGKKADVSPHLCLENIDPIWFVLTIPPSSTGHCTDTP